MKDKRTIGILQRQRGPASHPECPKCLGLTCGHPKQDVIRCSCI